MAVSIRMAGFRRARDQWAFRVLKHCKDEVKGGQRKHNQAADLITGSKTANDQVVPLLVLTQCKPMGRHCLSTSSGTPNQHRLPGSHFQTESLPNRAIDWSGHLARSTALRQTPIYT